MPTTLSTGIRQVPDGRSYIPVVRRLVDTAAFATGTTSLVIFDTNRAAAMRLHVDVSAIGADSTLTVTVQTGATTGLVNETVDSSSGGDQLAISATGVTVKTFAGLNRYSSLRVAETGGSAATTGLAIDAELI